MVRAHFRSGLLAFVLAGCTDGDDLWMGFADLPPETWDIAEPEGDGTPEDPFVIPVEDDWAFFSDSRDTNDARSDLFDEYGSNGLDESGPEYVYTFEVEGPVDFRAAIATPEPQGTDVDVHLLSDLDADALVARANAWISMQLDAGVYFLVLDTFVDGGTELAGPYELEVAIRPHAEGTVDDPIPLAPGALALPFLYTDARDTTVATGDDIDAYPPFSTNESGNEVVYTFTVDVPVRFNAEVIAPEPDGVDIDVHVLDSLDPVHAVDRDNIWVGTVLEPGTYWLALDTYAGDANAGPYTLLVQAREDVIREDEIFNEYVLEAVDYLWANYGLMGYDSQVLTHDIEYGDHGTIHRSGDGHTMCVAAVMEVILTALQMYEDDTGDETVWDFLPKSSWEGFGSDDIKAHIWVSYELETAGTPDALRHFAMGENIPFEDLQPGSFVGINRTTGSGHAVVFLDFIDIHGNRYDTWDEDVVGFYYFSSQGSYTPGYGGLDFRYAVFSDYGTPTMPGKADYNVILTDNQGYLNTGMMFAPSQWRDTPYKTGGARAAGRDLAFFDAERFDGVTAGDPQPPETSPAR